MTRILENISKSDVRIVLAVLLTLINGVILIMMFTNSIPENNKDVAYVAIGGLLSIQGQMVSFYFGSSKNETDQINTKKEQ